MKIESESISSRNRRAELILAFFIGIVSLVFMLHSWSVTQGISQSLLMSEFIVRCSELIDSMTGDKVLSMYMSQLSLTFITISVMSVLSEKTVTLYWINLVEENLITPRYSCFFAYVIYSFTTIVINLFAIIFENYLCFVVFFILNFVILFLLTYSMLTVYFNQESKERKAIKQFVNLKDEEERNIIIRKLKEYTLKAYANDDIDTLNKNLEFYSKYCHIDDMIYFIKRIDESNIEFLGEVLLKGYNHQIRSALHNKIYQCRNDDNLRKINTQSIDVFKHTMDRYNMINAIPRSLYEAMLNNHSRREYYKFYEQLLTAARYMMITHFEYISGMTVERSGFKNYNDFRHVIRNGIRYLKDEQVPNAIYAEKIYAYEQQYLACKNTEILASFFSEATERFYAYHDGYRRLPARTLLIILKGAIESHNHYFVTVFIATFQQFPIFKYVKTLEVEYSNNSVYKDIVTLCDDIKAMVYSENAQGEQFLNPDWMMLFQDVFGD